MLEMGEEYNAFCPYALLNILYFFATASTYAFSTSASPENIVVGSATGVRLE